MSDGARGESVAETGRPRFIQVAIQQAQLPAKEHMPYICGGYSVVLRRHNFTGSEDALFNIENRTAHDFFLRVGEASEERTLKLTSSGQHIPKQQIPKQQCRPLTVHSQVWEHRRVKSRTLR